MVNASLKSQWRIRDGNRTGKLTQTDLYSFRVGGWPPVQVDVSGAGHREAEPGLVGLTLEGVKVPEVVLESDKQII